LTILQEFLLRDRYLENIQTSFKEDIEVYQHIFKDPYYIFYSEEDIKRKFKYDNKKKK